MMENMKSRIKHLRMMLCVHSYLYYDLNENIVEDHIWDKWATELVGYQKTEWRIGYYDREFYDFDGSTGMHLPKNSGIISLANQLLKTHKEMK